MQIYSPDKSPCSRTLIIVFAIIFEVEIKTILSHQQKFFGKNAACHVLPVKLLPK